MSLSKRLKSFLDNINWLSKITGGKYEAALYIFKSKFKPALPGQGNFGHLPITFRKQDMSALREVLIDAEYAFLKPYIATSQPICILDLGAHIGTFALWCLSQNPLADIYSVEADPSTFAVLKTNMQPATHYGHTWRAVNRAAWKEEVALRFSVTGDSMSHKVSDDGKVKVLGANLENFFELSKFERIGLLKIDIEGAEEAFLTAQPELLNKVDMIVIEIHPKLCNEQMVRSLLAEHFQVIEDVQGRKSSKPLLLCRKYS